MPIHAYAALNKGEALQAYTYEARPLGPYDVRIQISHCGICHSDIHVLEEGWGGFPRVPGHEIIGQVLEIGPQVTQLSPGMRVGVGWQAASCLDCDYCRNAMDNLCAQQEATCVDHFGGFADQIIADSRYTFPIPEALASENAAPLLCGGITVYAPLRQYGVTPNSRVGVVGIGGLGHLGLQFAAAMGCAVTAISTSPDKEAEARSFGATGFINSRDDKQMKAAKGILDFLLVTVNVNLNWRAYLRMLRPNGTLCLVGLILEDITLPASMLVDGQRSIQGSAIGSRARMGEMLDFAARHGIVAQTETLPLSEVNTALAKVKANQARYRMVLTM